MLVLLTASSQLLALEDGKYGRFIGSVSTKWDDDNIHFTLLDDITFVDARRREWVANKGLRTDCASIPRLLWSLVGNPCSGSYRRAAVVHDRYCIDMALATSDDVHEMFYNAMLAAGTPKHQALVMYSAVYAAGPHWRKVKYVDGVEGFEVFRFVYPQVLMFPRSLGLPSKPLRRTIRAQLGNL